MNNIDQNYKINQDGKIYFLSLERFNDKIKIICKSIKPPSSNVYMGIFSLTNLQKHCQEFRDCSNIIEAQKLINYYIEKNKLIVRENNNNIDLQLFMENNQSPLNLDSFQTKNDVYPTQINNQNKQNIYYPKKRIKRDILSLYLAPKEKNNYIINSPLKNINNINTNQNENYSPISTSNTSPFTSPFIEQNNLSNSQSNNEIQIPEANPNLDTITKLNNLVNENNILKNQINNLNKQLNELHLKNQNYINNLQSQKSQLDSLLNQQQEIENLKIL